MRRLLLWLLLVGGAMEARTGGGRSVQSARDRIVGKISGRRARTPSAPPPAPLQPLQPPFSPMQRVTGAAENDLPPSRRRVQESESESESERETASGEDRLNPTLLGVVGAGEGAPSFPQIALLPGHELCSCHENPFLVYDAQRFDCFDPWHQQTKANCVKLCRCYGQDYLGGFISKLGKCVNITDAMERAPNETLRLQRNVGSDEDALVVEGLQTSLESCFEADLQCINDPTYRDADGEGCDYYAALPDPLVACAYPGFREALTRCPTACGTCDMVKAGWQEGDIIDTDGDGIEDVTVVGQVDADGYMVFGGEDRTSKLHEVNLRYFDMVQGTRSSCHMRNNLADKLHVTRYATRERCARECATFTLSTLDDPNAEKCIAFTFTQKQDQAAGTSNGLSTVCEFTSDAGCVSEHHLYSAENHTMYILKNTSSCDPLPGSPLHEDGCGACGGDNRTCTSSLELVVSDTDEPELVATQMPSLGSLVAGQKMFPRAHVHHDPTPTELQDQSRLLSKLGHQQWAPTQVFCILELYGSKGRSHELLASYGKDDLVFSFGSHPSGNTAEFLLTHPSAEEIGEVERVELTVIGGEHWLDGTHGRRLRGIRLVLTIDMQKLLWTFPLHMGDIRLDQTTTFTWHSGAHGQVLPTAMRQCHPDCTKSTHERAADEDRTLRAFTVETDRNGMRVPTQPLERYRGALDGCVERCTTTYEMVSAVNRATRGGARDDCTPDPVESDLCPNAYYPVCGADGRTYRNSCVSAALCAIVHHLGSCGIGRDTTYHKDVEARRLSKLHEAYVPKDSEVVFQHGIFGDPRGQHLTEE